MRTREKGFKNVTKGKSRLIKRLISKKGCLTIKRILENIGVANINRETRRKILRPGTKV